MSVSSGTVSLFASVAVAIAAAGGAAYGLRHKTQVAQLVRQITAPHAAGVTLQDENQVAEVGGEGAAPPYAGDVTLRASDAGHFETDAEINGRSVEVMVDTGATLVALTYEDAERAGIYLKSADFTHSVSTANGEAKIAPVEISSINIGGITVRNVSGAVSERGKLHRTLLGMSFLGRLSRVDMRAKTLVLHE